MSAPTHPESPPQLARFAPEVRAAYGRFRESRDLAAAQIVVQAALLSFLPSSSAHATAEELDGALRLVEDLGYDSLAVAELVFFLEDLFTVRIESEDLLRLRTVGELRAFVSDRLVQSGDGS